MLKVCTWKAEAKAFEKSDPRRQTLSGFGWAERARRPEHLVSTILERWSMSESVAKARAIKGKGEASC